jgi:histidine triad (HIT) family protein
MACAFCQLLDNGDARWVIREPAVVAFLPLEGSELAPGHTLVVPRRHAATLLDADEDTLPWLRQRSTRKLAGPAERLLAAALG